LPLDRARRVEVTGGVERLSFGREHRVALYDLDSGSLLSRTTEHSTPERPITVATMRAAYVHDTSVFGATGPLHGRRVRLEAGGIAGSLGYATAMADVRQYVMPVRPVTLAVRAFHLGRYGADGGDRRLVPYFIGYPELVRGYGFGSFDARECGIVESAAAASVASTATCAALDRLSGSRIGVVNVELRAPVAGLFRGRVEYGRVPVDLVTFFDAGAAWSAGQHPSWRGGGDRARPAARSAGVAVRVNVFGLFAAELSLARPFDRASDRWRWQLGIRQGF
jgi:outer membrane protein assembly factor BamA